MQDLATGGMDIYWWLSFVEIPALVGIFQIVRSNKQDEAKRSKTMQEEIHKDITLIHKEIADFKLQTAKEYASIKYMKDVEKRLTDHLLRIEEKLEKTSTSRRKTL